MTTLQQQMQDRMNSRPDAATLAWWQDQFEQVARGYRGLTHAVNVVLADIEDRDAVIRSLREQSENQAKELHNANVLIGKLQAEVVLLQESVEKARKVFSEIKASQSQGG